MDWSKILTDHDRWLRTIVFARLGEREAVDDVMQEVSLAAVKQAAPLTDPAKVAPWLYRLAVRQSMLYRRGCGRRKKLRQRYSDVVQTDETDRTVPEPLDWLLATERQQLIRKTMAQLPPRDAEILLLKYSEGWSYHEIAARLGVSHSAVETRLHRARAKLRQELFNMQVLEARQ
ncbi:MAG: sigma-70 family RNA polymerase sigma factor [Planctomycetes bacterium]|nr:sigma-70 family RNA polymerase sigma factor [Planctomycetota bacterium]